MRLLWGMGWEQGPRGLLVVTKVCPGVERGLRSDGRSELFENTEWGDIDNISLPSLSATYRCKHVRSMKSMKRTDQLLQCEKKLLL